MDLKTSAGHEDLRSAIAALCADFPGEYWRSLEPDKYPDAFVETLTKNGWLSVLIPEEYGGGGATLTEASIILEEIAVSGGNPSACHAQMYVMGTLLRHGSDAQKQQYLPKIAAGELRLQAFGVTEPSAGSETTKIRTKAERVDGGWKINGQKIWTSRALHSDLMLLLARTSPFDESGKPSAGMSVFIFDMRNLEGLTIRPIKTMMNHNTTEVFFDNVVIPEDSLIGEEGKGFKYILDGMNAERILIAAECIGDGRFFLDRAVSYANSREIFGGPIGKNQGVQFPLARSYMQLRAADLVRFDAAARFDAGEDCGAQANTAKFLAAEASWAAGNAAIDTHGGMGFAEEYDIERKFRETRLYQVAPINNNLVMAYIGQHVLGLPKSY
ncbi:MAG: acyl-CoA dehydrogenase family protein [Actinomycetes bacterium]